MTVKFIHSNIDPYCCITCYDWKCLLNWSFVVIVYVYAFLLWFYLLSNEAWFVFILPLAEIPTSDPDVPLEHFPEKIVEELGQIAKWLDKKGNTAEFTKDYQKMRGTTMLKSLQVYILFLLNYDYYNTAGKR